MSIYSDIVPTVVVGLIEVVKEPVVGKPFEGSTVEGSALYKEGTKYVQYESIQQVWKCPSTAIAGATRYLVQVNDEVYLAYLKV